MGKYTSTTGKKTLVANTDTELYDIISEEIDSAEIHRIDLYLENTATASTGEVFIKGVGIDKVLKEAFSLTTSQKKGVHLFSPNLAPYTVLSNRTGATNIMIRCTQPITVSYDIITG